MTLTDLGEDLDALVRQMVKDASKEGVGLEERAKVLKMASQHHATMVKLRGSRTPKDERGSGPNMSDLRNRLNDESGTTQQPAEGDEEDDE